MPSGEKAIQNLQKDKGIVARFVLGYTLDPEEMAVLEMEEKMYGSMIRLDVREKYHNLVLKMRRYMQKAEELYDFNYILKVSTTR